MASEFFGYSSYSETSLCATDAMHSKSVLKIAEGLHISSLSRDNRSTYDDYHRSPQIVIPTHGSQFPTNLLSSGMNPLVHRSTSSPCAIGPHPENTLGSIPPQNVIDPRDGHLWRAKYCILENGALYFYRNEEDAKSPEAKSERDAYFQNSHGQLPPSAMSTDFLSMSPIPRRNMNISSNYVASVPEVMWEKRVALDCVGAVRSAEDEYGQWSFTLYTSDEYNAVGKEDCLVLRAGSKEQMQEWLFQFHRSLASIVKDMVFYPHLDGSTLKPPGVLYPLVGVPAQNWNIDDTMSMTHVPPNNISFSPKYLQGGMFGGQSLSHGHGRNGIHRRRVREKATAASLCSSRNSSFEFSNDTAALALDAVLCAFALTDDDATNDSVVSKSTAVDSIDVFPCEVEDVTVNSHAPLVDLNSVIPPVISPAIQPIPKGKYVPPHLRKQKNEPAPIKYVPPHLRNKKPKSNVSMPLQSSKLSSDTEGANKKESKKDNISAPHFMLGGCADQSYSAGSIMDNAYKKRSVKLGKGRTDSYGYSSGSDGVESSVDDSASVISSLKWQVGAVSACGVRECNEDAYIVANDLLSVLEGREDEPNVSGESSQGLFAIFDGHCGFQTARYAAEKLPSFLLEEIMKDNSLCDADQIEAFFASNDDVENGLLSAMASLDKEFCDISSTDGRQWGDCGATALVTILSNESIFVANLGDCRGILSGSCSKDQSLFSSDEGWCLLEDDDHMQNVDSNCFWREVNTTHTPSLLGEKSRIEAANGWVTTEQELCIGQIHNMVLEDKDVSDILRRWFSHRFENEGSAAAPGRLLTTARICGELAVSRALGDKDFKCAFNTQSTHVKNAPDEKDGIWWEGPCYLPYADSHNRCFQGDLVSATPEVQVLRVGKEGVFNEFLLLACDGLWDVMDADDAVRIVKGLMFEQGWSAKDSAARLAQIAIHLGSSDNTTVILIRFFRNRT